MQTRARRYVFFALAILVGFAAGTGYGWVINPVQYHNTSPDTLQIDYQTDYVLMVAELYHAEGDLAMALTRLDFLGETPPVMLMNEAITYADALRYADRDLQLMRRMAFDIQQALDRAD